MRAPPTWRRSRARSPCSIRRSARAHSCSARSSCSPGSRARTPSRRPPPGAASCPQPLRGRPQPDGRAAGRAAALARRHRRRRDRRSRERAAAPQPRCRGAPGRHPARRPGRGGGRIADGSAEAGPARGARCDRRRQAPRPRHAADGRAVGGAHGARGGGRSHRAGHRGRARGGARNLAVRGPRAAQPGACRGDRPVAHPAPDRARGPAAARARRRAGKLRLPDPLRRRDGRRRVRSRGRQPALGAREELPRTLRQELAERYRWFRPAGGRGYRNYPDLSVAFVERGLELLSPGGMLALLVPAKLATAGYAAALRHGLASGTTLHRRGRHRDHGRGAVRCHRLSDGTGGLAPPPGAGPHGRVGRRGRRPGAAARAHWRRPMAARGRRRAPGAGAPRGGAPAPGRARARAPRREDRRRRRLPRVGAGHRAAVAAPRRAWSRHACVPRGSRPMDPLAVRSQRRAAPHAPAARVGSGQLAITSRC